MLPPPPVCRSARNVLQYDLDRESNAGDGTIARPKNQTKRREELVAAAQRAIATRGLGALRLRDIADEAGVSGPAVSYYYPDLDDLIVDVYKRQTDIVAERGPVAIAGLVDPWDQLVAAVYNDLPTGPDDVDAVITYLFAGEPRFNRTYSKMSSALHEHQISFFSSILDAGIASGRFAPSLETATIANTIVALSDSYGLQVILEERGMSREAAAEETLRVAAAILGIEPSASEFP